MPNYTFGVYQVQKFRIIVEAKDAETAQDIALNANFDGDLPMDEYVDEARLLETDDPSIEDTEVWNDAYAKLDF